MKISSGLTIAAFFFGLELISCTTPKTIVMPETSLTQRTFPSIQVKNLTDETKSFPAGFPGERTLLLIAFEREQQDILDEWVAKLNLRKAGAPGWLELPIIDDPGAFMRWFIDNGMKSGIPDQAMRARVFTIYTPRIAFVSHLGLPDARQVHLAIADRAGHILHHVSGSWTAAKERSLRAALR
ncbi:MAG: hypothetical protein RIS79_2508 [Verrucomicrobiota bacterium]|jgi:hypothetical protein